MRARTYNIFISKLSLPNNTSQLKKQQISKENLLLQFAFRAILGQKERQTCLRTSLSLFGAGNRTRTCTLLAVEPKSTESTNSTMPAYSVIPPCLLGEESEADHSPDPHLSKQAAPAFHKLLFHILSRQRENALSRLFPFVPDKRFQICAMMIFYGGCFILADNDVLQRNIVDCRNRDDIMNHIGQFIPTRPDWSYFTTVARGCQ